MSVEVKHVKEGKERRYKDIDVKISNKNVVLYFFN